jgi:hypothetical protein
VASDYRDPVADIPPFLNILKYRTVRVSIIEPDISRQSLPKAIALMTHPCLGSQIQENSVTPVCEHVTEP